MYPVVSARWEGLAFVTGVVLIDLGASSIQTAFARHCMLIHPLAIDAWLRYAMIGRSP